MGLSAGRKSDERSGKDFSFLVNTGSQIWQGGLVMLAAGLAEAAAAAGSSGAAAGLVVVGLAQKSVLGDGIQRVPVRTGCFLFNNSAGGDLIAAANIGAPAFVVDDETVALTSNASVRPKAGTIVDVESTGVWVRVGV